MVRGKGNLLRKNSRFECHLISKMTRIMMCKRMNLALVQRGKIYRWWQRLFTSRFTNFWSQVFVVLNDIELLLTWCRRLLFVELYFMCECRQINNIIHNRITRIISFPRIIVIFEYMTCFVIQWFLQIALTAFESIVWLSRSNISHNNIISQIQYLLKPNYVNLNRKQGIFIK